MNDDELDQKAEALARPEVRKLLDPLPLAVGQLIASSARRLGGGWLPNRAYHLAGEAIEKAFAARCSAEQNVLRRLALPITGARQQRLRDALGALADEAFKSLEVHAFLRNDAAVGGSAAKIEARGRLAGVARDLVAALAAELSLPAVDVGQAITVNVNAPNHGIVAGKIESLHVSNADAGRELQGALREILAAVGDLEQREKARADEARELIAELLHQAESRPQPVLVRSGAARLKDLLSVVAAGARVVELVEKLPHLIHQAATAGARMILA